MAIIELLISTWLKFLRVDRGLSGGLDTLNESRLLSAVRRIAPDDQ